MMWLLFLWMDFLFWLAMVGVLVLAYPEWRIWWNVYKWKRQMKRGFEDEWDARQRSGGNDSTAG
jgi:hypothetical protein